MFVCALFNQDHECAKFTSAQRRFCAQTFYYEHLILVPALSLNGDDDQYWESSKGIGEVSRTLVEW